MPTRSVELTERLDRFVEDEVLSGEFSDASEVVREGLRLLEQRKQEFERKLEWLRGAVQEGVDDIERGDYVTLRTEEDLEAFMRGIHEEVVARQRSEVA